MSDINLQFFHIFLFFGIEERDGNAENRLLRRRERDRRGLHHGRGTRPLFSRGGVSFLSALFLRAVLWVLRLFSRAREEVRRVRRCPQSGVRAVGGGSPRPIARLRLCAVRRDARGARRALSGGKTSLGNFGARVGVGARAPRHEGGLRAQFVARPAARCLCRVRRTGRRFIGNKKPARSLPSRRRTVCGDERLSHRPRPHGTREGRAAPRNFLGRLRRRGLCVRRLHPGAGLRRGRGIQRGDALPCRHAKKPPLLRRGGCRHLHVPRLLALSAHRRVPKGARQGKIRRRGRGAPCGVYLFEIGSFGHRRLFLSRSRRGGTAVFSFLRSSRVPFPAPPRESTSPRRECRE